MKATDHSRELEQVMAYVDGALDLQTAENVRTHIAGCSECSQVEQDLRGVSEGLRSWDVGAAPPLRAPIAIDVQQSARNRVIRSLVSRRGLLAAAACIPVVVIGGAMLLQQRKSPTFLDAESRHATSTAPALAANERVEVKALPAQGLSSSRSQIAGAAGAGPMIVRKARLSIIATDYDKARAALDRILKQAGGFVGSIVVQQGTGSSARRLDATLRVPTLKLDETIAALRALGQVTSEGQDGEDVTQQSADLDVRLENARVSEKRLRDILAQRAGKLSDVLDVEREIARVRGEIEQMESERRSLDRRVSYATVALSLSEHRKSEVDLGPVPVARRFRNAFVEGWSNAIATAVDVSVFLVQIAPTLLLWGVVLTPIAVFVRRRLA